MGQRYAGRGLRPFTLSHARSKLLRVASFHRTLPFAALSTVFGPAGSQEKSRSLSDRLISWRARRDSNPRHSA